MSSTRLTIAASFSTLLLGCGGSSISNVQDAHTKLDKTLTFSQILDNRQACADYDWAEFEDDKGRIVVENTCHLKDAEEYFESLKSDQITAAKQRYEDAVKHAKLEYDNRYAANERAKKRIEEIKASISQEQSKLDELNLITTELHAVYKLSGADYRSAMDEFKVKYPDVDPKMLSSHVAGYENRIEKAEYNIGFITRERLVDNDYIEDSYTKTLADAEAAKESTIAKVESQYDLSDAIEVFQWSFDKDELPVPLYAGVRIISADGQEFSSSTGFQYALEYAHGNTANSIAEHLPTKIYLANGLKLRD